MPMPLTDYDFSLFEPAPARSSAAPQVKPRREPVREVRSPKGESLQAKNAKAHKVWMRSLISYAVVSAVGVCMFAVVQTELDYHRAMVKQQELRTTLSNEQQRNVNYRTQIDHMYSLEIVHNLALNEYHMVPIEGGRVTYLNILRGDQRLK